MRIQAFLSLMHKALKHLAKANNAAWTREKKVKGRKRQNRRGHDGQASPSAGSSGQYSRF